MAAGQSMGMKAVPELIDPHTAVEPRLLRRTHDEETRSTLVGSLVAEMARAHGDDVALLDAHHSRSLTWREVAAAAESWRDRPDGGRQQLALADTRVGLVMTSPVEFAREYLAALAGRVTVVPLDPGCSEAELLWSASALALTHVMSDGGELIKLHSTRSSSRRRHYHERPPIVPLVGDYPLRLDAVQGVLWGTLGVGRAWHPSVAPIDIPMPKATDLAAPAVVIPTKGSTGAPKLVPFSEAQLLGSAARVVSHFGLGQEDRGYIVTPLHAVDAQVVGILATLLSGGSVVVAEPFDRRSFWAGVDDSRATWLNLVPAVVRSLATVAPPNPVLRERVRFARVGGAALPLAAHSEFWQSTGISLIETYTLTEAAGPVAANPLDVGRRRAGSAGLPVGTEIRVVDDEGAILGAGRTGRVQVKGAVVSTHYLSYGRNRAFVPAQEADGWFDTGDLGCTTRSGYLYLAGRR